MKTGDSNPAFTLIELLVVVGIIILMAGSLGLALRGGSPGRTLESDQTALASLVTAARGEAVSRQNRVTLLVDADPAEDHFLRRIRVAIESAPQSGIWWIADKQILLSAGIYFVPGNVAVAGATFAPAGSPPVAWPPTRRSSVTLLADGSVSAGTESTPGKYLGLSVPLAATGRPDGTESVKLVLAVARRTSGGVIFEHPEQVRGIILSSYGSAIFIHNATGFDF